MDLIKLAEKLPLVLLGTLGIVSRVRGASDEDKKQAVIDAIKDSVSLAELVAGKDFLNDAMLNKLIEAVIDAEAAVLKARDALKQGILNKE